MSRPVIDHLPAQVRNAKPRERLVRGLRYWIREGVLEPGARLPSEHELAASFEVARSTVRLALQQLADEGAIRVTGRARVVSPPAPVAPASTAGLLGTQTVVLLADSPTAAMPSQPLLRGWSHYLHVGASEYLRQAGLHVMTMRTDLLDETRAAQLIAARPLGMIAVGRVSSLPAGPALCRAIHAAGIPLVTLARETDLPVDRVASDHAAGCELLTRWLLARGCRRIQRVWSLSVPPPRPDWLAQRDVGYERAVAAAGVPCLPYVEYRDLQAPGDPATVFQTHVRYLAGLLVETLRAAERPDALMLSSDGQVSAAAAALRLFGLEPQRDVAIVGYDNYWADVPERQWESTIPLATVDKRNQEIGRTLVELLLARVRGELPAEPQVRLVPPELILPSATMALLPDSAPKLAPAAQPVHALV